MGDQNGSESRSHCFYRVHIQFPDRRAHIQVYHASYESIRRFHTTTSQKTSNEILLQVS